MSFRAVGSRGLTTYAWPPCVHMFRSARRGVDDQVVEYVMKKTAYHDNMVGEPGGDFRHRARSRAGRLMARARIAC